MAFNSDEYGWSDLSLVMLGRPVIGLRGVRYKESQEKSNIYATGKRPISRGRGNVEYEGEIRVLHSELRALLQSAGNASSLLDIEPFDITIVYGVSQVATSSTDQLIYCEFLEVEIDITQGDQMTEITLPIVIGKIQMNV